MDALKFSFKASCGGQQSWRDLAAKLTVATWLFATYLIRQLLAAQDRAAICRQLTAVKVCTGVHMQVVPSD